MISFKPSLTALLISAIFISVESDCEKGLETDQVMTMNLILTLSVGWNLDCNSVGNVTQTVTLFDYSFSGKSTDCVGEQKMSSKRYLKVILDIYL